MVLRCLIFSFIIIALGSQATKAQYNSPYSRYALGDLYSNDNIENKGTGGVSIAQNSSLRVNYLNPASFANIGVVIFQLGVTGTRATSATASSSKGVGNFSLNNFNFGVPITKKGGLSFGLMPYSKVNYGLTATKDLLGTDSGKQITDYIGGGNLQNAYFGFGYKIKNLSIGASGNFLFGNISNQSKSVFENVSFTYPVSIFTTKYARGFVLNTGALYEVKLNNKQKLKIGATYTLPTNLNASVDTAIYTFLSTNQGEFRDSIYSSKNTKGTIVIPSQIGAGLMYEMDNKWRAGLDFTTSNWTTFEKFGEKDSTTNSWQLKAGFAYIPNPLAITGTYWSKAEYRIGAFTGKEILAFNSNGINNTGMSVGMGLPLRRSVYSTGTFNIALQAGVRGSTSNALVRETYTRLSVGVTLNDVWFIKRRYD
jgi:hypothetical protein